MRNLAKDSPEWTKQSNFSCEICKDKGFIINEIANSAKRCSCQEAKDYEERLLLSGISEEFRKRTFDIFEERTEEAKKIKTACVEYSEKYREFEKEKKNSMILVGKVGSGKTHLGMAMANELLKKGIGVLYVSYPSMVHELKQVSMNTEEFNRIINGYKNCRILFIDDFMKALKEADLNYIYQIVNYRYLNNKPFIITSEFMPSKWSDIDEAIGTRLYEMAKSINQFKETGNYRTKGVK